MFYLQFPGNGATGASGQIATQSAAKGSKSARALVTTPRRSMTGLDVKDPMCKRRRVITCAPLWMASGHPGPLGLHVVRTVFNFEEENVAIQLLNMEVDTVSARTLPVKTAQEPCVNVSFKSIKHQ